MNEKRNHKHCPHMWHSFTNALRRALSRTKALADLLLQLIMAACLISTLWLLDKWDEHRDFLVGVFAGILLGVGFTLYFTYTPLKTMMAKAELAEHYKQGWLRTIQAAEASNERLDTCYEAWDKLFTDQGLKRTK